MAMVALVADPERRAALGIAAKERAATVFSRDKTTADACEMLLRGMK